MQSLLKEDQEATAGPKRLSVCWSEVNVGLGRVKVEDDTGKVEARPLEICRPL